MQDRFVPGNRSDCIVYMSNSLGIKEYMLRLAKRLVFKVVCQNNLACYFKIKAVALNLAAQCGLYEKFNLDLLKKFVKEGDLVLDVGANFGVYTTALAKIVGSNGKVIAFEPIPWVFEILRSRAIQFTNIVCIQEGLSDHCSESETIHIPLISDGLPEPALASLEVLNIETEEIKIRVNQLDNFHADLKRVRFIKVDIEGHEERFLLGAEKVIKSEKPIIQLEENNPDNIIRYMHLCKKWGYRLVDFNSNGEPRDLQVGMVPRQRNIYLIPDEDQICSLM